MKKIIKNNIFGFILGAIIFGSIVGVSAYTIYANNIGYTPSDTTWKKANGEDITNVEEAINELYASSLSTGYNTIELKYGDFQQLGNYSTTTKQYTFTTETAGKIIVVMNATGSNSGVTGRTTRYVRIDGVDMPLTNVVADSWQFATYYVGDVAANSTVQSYVSNAASGSLNTAGLFVFFLHN